MSDSLEPLRIDVRHGIAMLVLARATRGNALDAALVESMLAQADALARRDDVHTWVLRGDGDQFCTGFDLSDSEAVGDAELLLRFVRVEMLLQAIASAPARTVAYAHGRAWGAGADLFAACDVRVAHASATFRFPGVRFGLVVGTRRLAERIGTQAAQHTLLEGRTLDAADALRLGLATHRVDESFEAWLATLREPIVDAVTRRSLLARTRSHDDDADLAALVRSASRPGLAARIAAYRKAVR